MLDPESDVDQRPAVQELLAKLRSALPDLKRFSRSAAATGATRTPDRFYHHSSGTVRDWSRRTYSRADGPLSSISTTFAEDPTTANDVWSRHERAMGLTRESESGPLSEQSPRALARKYFEGDEFPPPAAPPSSPARPWCLFTDRLHGDSRPTSGDRERPRHRGDVVSTFLSARAAVQIVGRARRFRCRRCGRDRQASGDPAGAGWSSRLRNDPVEDAGGQPGAIGGDSDCARRVRPPGGRGRDQGGVPGRGHPSVDRSLRRFPARSDRGVPRQDQPPSHGRHPEPRRRRAGHRRAPADCPEHRLALCPRPAAPPRRRSPRPRGGHTTSGHCAWSHRTRESRPRRRPRRRCRAALRPVLRWGGGRSAGWHPRRARGRSGARRRARHRARSSGSLQRRRAQPRAGDRQGPPELGWDPSFRAG